MNVRWPLFIRKIHYWATVVIVLPVAVVITTGLLLQLKKQWTWVQPATQAGSAEVPALSFEAILRAAATVPEAKLNNWTDIDRLDVRPGKGIIKIRGKNRWEIQIDAATGEVLQTQYRRSDLIESLHDGSFFHPLAKLWIFLPIGVVLLLMWCTGAWLFVFPYWKKSRR